MIQSVAEFVFLRYSDAPQEYHRAAHDEAPLNVWRDVVAGYPDMRQWVVHNKTVPLVILEELLVSADEDLRWWIATKRKLSHELFDRLSQDPSDSVRLRIAANAKAPDDILQLLTSDPSSDVATWAKQRLLQRQEKNR